MIKFTREQENVDSGGCLKVRFCKKEAAAPLLGGLLRSGGVATRPNDSTKVPSDSLRRGAVLPSHPA